MGVYVVQKKMNFLNLNIQKEGFSVEIKR